MADEKAANIVIKRINKGHAGAHGGAWKVAYADFVTAMMAFFLVMWLMGADEETKAAVEHYFNNPTSAWRRDMSAKEVVPLGDLTGAGDSVLSGAGGGNPEDMIERPSRPVTTTDVEASKAGEILAQFLSDESMMNLDMIRFSLPEEALFRRGTTDQWSPAGEKLLKRFGVLMRKYKGKLQVHGTFVPARPGASPIGTYEFQMSRAATLARYVVDQNWAREEQVTAFVSEDKGPEGSGRKIEFTLSREAN